MPPRPERRLPPIRRIPGGLRIARAVAAALRSRSAAAWTVVEYDGADWTHGYCAGTRTGAWSFTRGLPRRLAAPPALLQVPCAQFCVDGNRVLIEWSVKQGTGEGSIMEIKRVGTALKLVPTGDGRKWRLHR
ncbi:MAG: hypothetical protein HUU15_01145 [Candidatus Brocadiae bacterium]|nr:hypothetical protein [Candidatus Brocadiia bacterium]